MDGIKAYWREPLERWRNYRGLWRESLDERPSAASVYRRFFISLICLYVPFAGVNSYRYELVNRFYQPERSFIFPSMGGPISMSFFFVIFLFIVYRVLWHWGKTKNNRHVISVLMYLMILLTGMLVAGIVGGFYRIIEIGELERFIYEAYGLKNLFAYSMILTLLVSPILVMWIQGWRQALIFSPILVLPCYIIMWLASGTPK